MNSSKPLWQVRLLHVSFTFSALLYLFITVNVPYCLIPAGGHDDGLYMQHGFSLASGNWLGPYNQFTLMKGAGYPMFLAALSWFRIPVSIGHAVLFALATWVLALLARRLSGSLLLSFATFELVLWNFGPDSNRVVRDDIYYSQFLLAFSLLVLAYLERGRRAYRISAGAGLCFGWLWITREEGLVSVPAMVIVMAYFLWKSWGQLTARRTALVLTAVFTGSALAPSVYVAARNLRRYHKFEAVDIKGEFAGALSALESIEQRNERPFLAVSREVREKAYAVSPTFARLRTYFDGPATSPVSGWKDASCHYLPQTCGDYGMGWFPWALRDAAAMDGAFADARTSSDFFHAIRTEIGAACTSGRLQCHHSAIPFLPHVTPEEVRALPATLGSLLRKLLFLEPPPVQDGPSVGTPQQVRDAVVFTNIQNYSPPPEISSVMLNERNIKRALAGKTSMIRLYGLLMPIFVPMGLLAFLVGSMVCAVRREFPLLLALTLAAWTEIGLRLLMLALIDVTSFGAVYNMYMSLAFPVSCLASILSLQFVFSLYSTRQPRKSSLPRPFRGVGESRKAAPPIQKELSRAGGGAQRLELLICSAMGRRAFCSSPKPAP